MYKITFCITTYNRVEKLSTCINSVLEQDMDPFEYELIVVDDCSTDNTSKYLDDVISANPNHNIRYIRLEKNSGNASTPRNVAINNAHGEYIIFIDSDDYISANTARHIMDFSNEYSPDIIYLKYGSGENLGGAKGFSSNGTIVDADIIDNALLYSLSVQKAFKLSEIKRLNLNFDKNIKVGEDMLFTTEFLFNTQKHSILADDEYYFLEHHKNARLTDGIGVSISDTFYNYIRIMKLIDTGSSKDQVYKDKAAARFIHRILTVGRGANKYYLEAGYETAKVEEFYIHMKLLLDTSFPQTKDKYLAKQYQNIILSMREGTLLGNRLALDIVHLKNIVSYQDKKINQLERNVNNLLEKLNN